MGKNREFWRKETESIQQCQYCSGTGLILVRNDYSQSGDFGGFVREEECFLCDGTGQSLTPFNKEQDDEE